MRPGGGLAPRCNMAVARDGSNRIAHPQGVEKRPQGGVLLGSEGLCVGAFQLNTDRIVVAVGTLAPARLPGMPSPPVTADELDNPPIASNVEMRRHLQTSDGREIGMRCRIETIQEEALHP